MTYTSAPGRKLTMHSQAYHRIRTSDEHFLEGPVSVHLDAEGNISQWHRLREEEPFTAWVGGELKTNCSYRQLLSLEVKTD
ncbi:MAG: hypothetical protein PUE11_04755 [Paraprevotella sp.]|nr:hypothetical protein [Paraprevotella sp.]MDY3891019.1 hypothetical protein [Bacteroidaceae bacterium]MDD5971902.1 hypothetical protein [Paraprevotella sp.]MDD6126409.1 hypothetical protein [Paraprevotella sp.]MDD6758790.1 hypothetical protein [Paraprevotella sp.]